MKTIRRRRKENKTDYKARFSLIKSAKPRLVIRKTNKYILAQVVETTIAQDKVLMKVSSKDLLAKGWPKEKAGSLKSIQAAYLTGYLLGKTSKVKELIIDTGLNRNIHGSRIYAVVKGAVDAGIKIPHDPKALPTDERLKSNEKTSDLLKLKEKL